MNAIIQKSNNLKGAVVVPASKSQTIRGLILGLLTGGESTLVNPLRSDDITAAIKVCRALGAKIAIKSDKIVIKAQGLPRWANKINTGNSGITTRFILPVLGLCANALKPIIVDCDKQMRQRPIAPLVNALNDLGMTISYKKQKGRCPLLVSGKLAGGNTEVDGTTSQYLSALLMSLPLAKKDSEIRVKNLHERPYAEMTLKWLKDLAIEYSHRRKASLDVFKIKGGQKYRPFKKTVPGDFSSASCLIAAGCLSGKKVVLKGLDMKDAQGDKKLIEILKKMGASIKISKNQIFTKGGKLHGIDIDANGIPDLVPILAVIGTQASGITSIRNVPQARIKETDRIKSMAKGLSRMRAKVKEKKDGLLVYQSLLKGAAVKGYNDHRTVMAFTVAGLTAEDKTIVKNAEAVNKTYPNFFEHIKKLGAKVKLHD